MQDFYLLKDRETRIARFFNLAQVKDANLMLKNLRAVLYGKQLVISLNRIAKNEQTQEAFDIFEQALGIDIRNTTTLT
jgi:hypothetical protein